MSKAEVIPKSVLEKVELLKKEREYKKKFAAIGVGYQIIKQGGRQAGWTWAQQILDAEYAQIEEQKLIEYQQSKL